MQKGGKGIVRATVGHYVLWNLFFPRIPLIPNFQKLPCDSILEVNSICDHLVG